MGRVMLEITKALLVLRLFEFSYLYNFHSS